MKKYLAFAAGLLLSFSAAAEMYVGAKAGRLAPDTDDVDAANAGSLTIGYEFVDVWVADFSIEAEYTRTLEDGDAGPVDWNASSLGGFAVVRTGGPAYLRARAGLVNQTVEVGSADETELKTAAGIGFGFSLLGLETSLDWTRYMDSGDIDTIDYLSIGLRF